MLTSSSFSCCSCFEITKKKKNKVAVIAFEERNEEEGAVAGVVAPGEARSLGCLSEPTKKEGGQIFEEEKSQQNDQMKNGKLMELLLANHV